MIKIGYLGGEDPVGLELLEEVQPTRISQLTSDFVKNCPAINNYYKNTFEIRSPYTLDFTIKQSRNGPSWEIHDTTLAVGNLGFDGEKILQVTGDGDFVQIYPRPQWGFISDTKNVIMFQHSNGITTNPPVISGMYDIYKWPDRNLSLAYKLEFGKRITIKKGEPLYYVTFITPNFEPVKLIRMYERTGFLKSTRNKENLSFMSKQNWPKVFEYFGRSRPKKLIEE
jgi:hypothetical protein